MTERGDGTEGAVFSGEGGPMTERGEGIDGAVLLVTFPTKEGS
jgi:hypothetical protein